MLHLAPFVVGSLMGYTAAVKLAALYHVMKEYQDKENLNEVLKDDEEEELENLND